MLVQTWMKRFRCDEQRLLLIIAGLSLLCLGLLLWAENISIHWKTNAQNSTLRQTCGDGKLSPHQKFFEQYRWVEENYTFNPAEVRQPRNIPLIYYDKRILYHPVYTGGCKYKCKYSHQLSDLPRARLAVFTNDVPTEAFRAGRRAIWAFESGEPLHLLPKITEEAKNKISMFITHHTFADVTFFYGYYWANEKPECLLSRAAKLHMKSKNSLKLLPKHHSQRTKKIAWAVSKHEATNRRRELAEAISKHMHVDIYGHGSDSLKCPNEGDCFDWLSKQYKFYLAFENSNCEGYITEKVYSNAYRTGMVPIVYGPPKEEYEVLTPPNSFIHVDDFATVKELVGYLEYLDQNDTAYATYFAWKEYGKIVSWPRIDCRVCGVLHQVLDGTKILKANTFDSHYDKWRTCTYDHYIKF